MDEKLHELSRQAAEETACANNAESAPKTESGAGGLSEKSFRGSAYDPRGIERWLAERAADGDELVDWNRFRTGEPRRCKFYLEPAAEKGGPDAALRKRRALAGWKFVCTSKNGVFYVWRGEAAAHTPAPRECTESYAYRTVRGKLLRSRLSQLLLPLAAALLCWWTVRESDLPVRGLITVGTESIVQGVSLLSSLVFAALSDAQERRNLRALKRAMENGESVGPARRDRWAKPGKIVSVVFLILTFVLGLYGRGASDGEMYDTPPLPYVSAEMLGGDAVDWYELCEQRTVLGGHISALGEPPYAGMIGDWWLYSTELDFYALRISALAAPLTHELRDYFAASGDHHESSARKIEADGFDEAYYIANTFFRYPNSAAPEDRIVRQFLILRRGGCVLFYRTEAPEGLLGHLDEFETVFEQYRLS